MPNSSRATLDDAVFDRLLSERIIVLGQEVDDAVANATVRDGDPQVRRCGSPQERSTKAWS